MIFMKGIAFKLVFLIVTLVVFIVLILTVFLLRGNEIMVYIASKISNIITGVLSLNPP